MNIDTVSTIIDMIESQLAYYARITGEDLAYVESKETGLVELRDHLQDFIESDLNAFENNQSTEQ